MRKVDDTQSKPAGQAIDPDTWVDERGDALFRYALLRMQGARVAEDVVQETFLAALRGRDSFDGRSSVKTWLFGILKHKIIDHKMLRHVASPESEVSFPILRCPYTFLTVSLSKSYILSVCS